MSDSQPKPPGPAGTPCPVCGTALATFTEEPGYTGPPRYWCPNLACDYMALPEPAAPVEAPLIASRPEVGERFAALRPALDEAEFRARVLRDLGALPYEFRDVTVVMPGRAADVKVTVGFQRAEPKLAALREDLVAAMTPELGPRLARDAVYGSTEAPAPWRWVSAGAGSTRGGRPARIGLVDADGNFIVAGGADGLAWVEVPSPRVRALTAAAPELEQRLLSALDLIRQLTPFAFAGPGGPALPAKVEVDDVYRSGRELLARINERSK